MIRRAIFRADASPALGGGHVMRCQTLARELQRRGWHVTFAMNTGASACVPGLAEAGFERVEGFDDIIAEPAALTARLPAPDFLVIDHYGWNRAREAAIRGFAGIQMAVDDFAVPETGMDAARVCDILLNTNIGAVASAYLGRVPAGTTLLAGPGFSLLRPEFAEAAETRLSGRVSEPETPQRVVLAFGLTDLGGITARVARIVRALSPDIWIDAIIGPAAQGRAELEALASSDTRLNVHLAPRDIAGIMARADIAIGAAGQSSYERCCLGLPSIALSLAQNQLFLVDELAKAGAAIHIRAMETGWEAGLGEAFTSLADNAERRATMGKAARLVCDGMGVIRVADAIEARLKGLSG